MSYSSYRWSQLRVSDLPRQPLTDPRARGEILYPPLDRRVDSLLEQLHPYPVALLQTYRKAQWRDTIRQLGP